MPQQSPSPLNPPPDPGFVPRKEFLRDQKTIPNSFAIVAISASSLVRVYSFPSTVIIALRVLLEASSSLVAFREDVQQHFCEFALTGRPWASPKSVRAEKLLIDILAAIYQCGYTYLSSLDYGRESDDRLAMAFSKPLTHSVTPLTANTSPLRDSSMSITSDRFRSRQTPFALSFLSPTLMRVIAPPLHLTPAILQAVRASWPRGVHSERKVGDNSFEFKLKGYKWFQQDTFATDSLRHILALLTSLDSQGFTLLSSLSMTSRSRVKDLWVFTGPGSDTTDESAISPSFREESNGDINWTYFPETSGKSGSYPGPTQHRRLASEPIGPSAHVPHHIRASTEQGNAQNFSLTRGYRVDYPSAGPALLRKPAPRAQVPVSIVHEADPPGTDGLRVYLPSSISSDVEDMTGIGARGFSFETYKTGFITEDPEQSPTRATAAPVPPSRTRSRSPTMRPDGNRHKTTPVLTNNLIQSSTPTHSLPKVGRQDPGTELLGSGTFRDSNASDASFNVPVQWTRLRDPITQQTEPKLDEENTSTMTASRRKAYSVGPVLPGSWQPSPIEEKVEALSGETDLDTHYEGSASKKSGNKTPIHQVASRVASPELTRPDMPLRKSEAALVGLITDPSSVPALPTISPKGTRAESPTSGKGQGWVLVNVGGSLNGSQVRFGEPVEGTKPPEGVEHPMPGPHARAIAVIDALDNKNKGKDKSDALAPVKKRFFSLGRKNSEKGTLVSVLPQSNVHARSPKQGSGLRDRFRITSN